MDKHKGEINYFQIFFKILSITLFILLQLFVVWIIYTSTYIISIYFEVTYNLIKIGSIVYLLYKPLNPSYRITWIILILLFPVFGLLCFIFFGNENAPKRLKVKSREIREESKDLLIYKNNLYDELKELNYDAYKQAHYLKEITGYPLYKNNNIKYLSLGEEYFKEMLEDMKKAENYIFLEYFIIAKSTIWDEMFKIIKEKASQGVKIYIITDQFGSNIRLPKEYLEHFFLSNIYTMVFNPFTPVISTNFNYRNHRKITVIDGKIAYTGGVNIGDEYINKTNRLGHWKDFGIKIEGNAVDSFITMFIRMWNSKSSNDNLNIEDFTTTHESNGKGYTIPFCDGPDNASNPAENTYINLINSAKKTIFITTPYLIIDNEILTALKNASKCGVDVRIIVPHIPDKKLVFMATRSYYDELLKSGIRIFEYEPGFIHGKMCLIDEETSVIGTINFDFRSLYLHYECGVWTNNTGIEKDMYEDFINIQNKSIEIKLKDWNKRSKIKKMLEAILRSFSPLL